MPLPIHHSDSTCWVPTTYTRYQAGEGHQYIASSLPSRNLRFKLNAHTDSHWPWYLLEWGKEKGLQDAGQWVRGFQASKGAAGRGKGLNGSRASVSLQLLSNDDLITRWSHYPVGRISHVWQGIPLLSRHTLFCCFLYVVSPALPWLGNVTPSSLLPLGFPFKLGLKCPPPLKPSWLTPPWERREEVVFDWQDSVVWFQNVTFSVFVLIY